MITNILRYFAKRTHNVQMQLLLATLFGCIELYGIYGTFAIISKNAKATKKRVKKHASLPGTNPIGK